VHSSDFELGEPARTIMKKALERGKHVVTANTGAMSLYYDELMEGSLQRGVSLLYEATVLSGTPSSPLSERAFPVVTSKGLRGYLMALATIF